MQLSAYSVHRNDKMGSLDFILPATTYRPPSSNGQAPRRKPELNTIVEESEGSVRGSAEYIDGRGRNRSPKNRSPKHASYLSPLSDHFPTPRGVHFMVAPIPPSETSSDSESVSPAPSSAPWTRQSYMTDATEFDDLYDVSSDEEARKKSVARKNSKRSSRSARRSSTGSAFSGESLSLVIPSKGDPWPGVEAFKLLTSPVLPTPRSAVPMSPAIFSYLQSQEAPSSSAPPSLDGSLNSEELAAISAPPTPDIGNNSEDEDGWGGVQLQPAAMATLQALAGGDDHHDDFFDQQPERVIELPSPPSNNTRAPEMQQSPPPLITNIHRNNSMVLSAEQQRSLNSLTKLEIPSPGGFFSALSPGARHTWHLVPVTPAEEQPPSSTTATNFYKAPWTNPISRTIEQIIEVPEMSETMSDGLPTARPLTARLLAEAQLRPEIRHEDSDETIRQIDHHSFDEHIVADEILANYEPGYARKIEDVSIANIDRTGLWLAAQSNYLAELINPTEARDDEVALVKRHVSVKSQHEEVEVEKPARKTVRFSEVATNDSALSCPKPSLGRQESAYYRAFQHLVARSRYRDTFVHRIPRFEALQSQRVSFPAAHRAQLLGKYQLSVVPMSAKRRMSANVARGDEIAPEDPEKLKRDREYEALHQMAPSTWNIMAVKLLNGGRLIAAPVAKRLARLSSMGPKLDGTPRDRARILDLGGQATCDWAWHCAVEYPNTKVYTVTTKALRQLSNSNIRGPKNHRNVAVEHLTKLPFADSQFDLISAREIYTILRQNGENGVDEWDLCLKECMRILKPGGYLEFSIMDSDIVNGGPMGLAKSVEFGFNLKTLGYDPTPTKLWLSRLKRNGFVGIKRAWVFLPMGSKVGEKKVERDSMGMEVKLELEAMVSGSTENAAGICGVVGGWAWEKWLLRCKVQTCGEDGGLDGIQEVVEEGRGVGAGWRLVNGWARKPFDNIKF
jgi:SAM-dependent methyltransferase